MSNDRMTFVEWQRSRPAIRGNPRWQANHLRHSFAPLAAEFAEASKALNQLGDALAGFKSAFAEMAEAVNRSALASPTEAQRRAWRRA